MKRRIGFLVTHGTDTLAWGLAYLQYTLCNCGFNIALVGSQVPMEDDPNGSDGYLNLEAAVQSLAALTPPNIFVATNAGRSIYHHNLWKIDKWDSVAFSGKTLVQKRSNQIVYDREAPFEGKNYISRLFLVKTGGTIEQSFSSGALRPDPRKDSVYNFLRRRFVEDGNAGLRIEDMPPPLGVFNLDSSDLTLQDWGQVAETIVDQAVDSGFNVSHDPLMESRVPLLFCTPLATAEDYANTLGRAPGCIVVGYGGGNLHLRSPDHSPLPVLRGLSADGGLAVVTSHPAAGALDPLYENGRAAFEEMLALPAVDFSLARAQIKLASILGHRAELEELADHRLRSASEWRRVAATLFLSGASFPTAQSRSFFEEIWRVRFPRRDLLLDLEFVDALAAVAPRLSGRQPTAFILSASEDLPDSVDCCALILKPDSIVGRNRRGEDVDAGAGLSQILQQGFEWPVLTGHLHRGDLFSSTFHRAVDRARIVFGEGGRQSVHNPASFEDLENYASLPEMVGFYRNLLRRRAISHKAAPGIYICLSHQLMAEAMRQQLVSVLRTLASANEDSWCQRATGIIEKLGGDFLSPTTTIVEAIDSPEHRIVTLEAYEPSKQIDQELIETHLDTAERFPGMVEDVLTSEALDLSMLHGDKVIEEGILKLNWAFRKLAEMRAEASPDVLKLLGELPVGIEVTSSTSDLDGRVLTEVASLGVYYKDADDFVYRDMCFQFHPELMLPSRLRELRAEGELTISKENDGLKILLGAILGSFSAFKC